MNKNYFRKQIPVHVTPSPEYPVLQAHVNEPTVFVHSARVSWQLSDLAVHSFTSEYKIYIKYV